MSGKVVNEKKRGLKSTILVYQNKELIEQIETSGIGKFQFSVKLNDTIAFVVLAEDYVSKTVFVNTLVPDKKLKQDFKLTYGAPIYKYYLTYKLEVAKELVIKKEKSIKEVSEYIGYSTSSHFISAFKKKYGVTPKKYQTK